MAAPMVKLFSRVSHFFVSLQSRLLRLHKMKSEVLWTLGGQILTLAGNILSIKALSLILRPAEYGTLALGLTISTFVNLILYGPIFQAFVRFFPEHQSKDTLVIFYAAVQTVLKKTTFINGLALAMLFPLLIFASGSSWALFLLISAVFGFFNSMTGGTQMVMMFQRQRKQFAFFQSLDIWLRFSFAGVFASFFNTATSAMTGYALGSLFVLSIQAHKLLHAPLFKSPWQEAKNKRLDSKIYESELWSYALPFMWLGPIGFMALYMDRWIIQWTLGPSEVGIYSALNQIVNTPTTLIATLTTQLFLPLVFSRAGDLRTYDQLQQSTNLVYKMLGLILILCLPALPICYFYHQDLMVMFTSRDFLGNTYIMWILAIGSLFFQLTQCSACIAQICKQTKIYISVFTIKFITMLALSILLFKPFGLAGICWSFTLSNLAYFLSMNWMNLKIISDQKKILLNVPINT